MRLSKTSQKILSIILNAQGRSFYINELIRLTGVYPNGIYQSLKSLKKQKILTSHKRGRLNFYKINKNYKHLEAIKKIIGTTLTQENKPSTKWVKILNRQTSHSFTMALCESNTTKLKEIYGVSVPSFWLNDITHGVYYPKKELHNLGKAVADLIDSDKEFTQRDINLCQQTCDKLVELSKYINKHDFRKLSNQKLAKLLTKFYKHYLAVFPFVTVPHGIERHFEEKIKEKIKDKKILELFLSPTTLTDYERDDALRIAEYAKTHGFNSKTKEMINTHTEKYCWLPLWSIFNQPLDRDYFEEEIKNILENIDNPEEEIERLMSQEKISREKLENTFEKINASRSLKEQVGFLQKYIHLRVYRKNTICQAHYFHLPLIYESGSRLGLTKKQVKLLSHKEIIKGLIGKLTKKNLKQIVKDRQKGWAIIMLNGKIRTIIGGDKIIEAIERYNIVSPTPSLQRIVKGKVACQGKVMGKVKIINNLSELGKVKKGDVLVTKMTTPDYMMAIHKAIAIVTDEGGVTCHAAIVSREFNIPCIVATKNATQVLTDNDRVKVDAYSGEVKVIETIDFPEDITKINAKKIYKGKVRGIARVIASSSDFSKIQSGDIIIAPQTTPEFLSALYRVKGFIVDEDSLTSHAMFCGKALKIPSVMGAKFARYAIKDGEKIELNASRGVIKKL